MRECNSPEPQYGGRKCIGKASDSDSCNKKVCPIGEYKSLLVNLNQILHHLLHGSQLTFHRNQYFTKNDPVDFGDFALFVLIPL